MPLLRGLRGADTLELAPFFDYGRGWNTGATDSTTRSDLYSVGIGLRWAATATWPIPLRSQLEVYWGYRLKDVPTSNGNLQDKGLHLQLVLSAF